MIVVGLFLTLSKYYQLKTKVLSKTLSVVASVGVIIMLTLQGCGTGTNLVATPNSWNFSISGDLYVGDTLKFQSTAGDNSIFLWTFGDGNSSTQAAPYFAYYSIAHDKYGSIINDTVTLVVNNDIYHSVVKTILLKPPVPRISQSWSWTGGYFKKFGTCCPTLSDHPLSDTNFAITRVDDYTINVWGENLPFLADSNYFSNIKATIPPNFTTVTFTRDTLFFRQSTGTDSGGVVITYYHKF